MTSVPHTAGLGEAAILLGYIVIAALVALVGAAIQYVAKRALNVELTWWFLLLSVFLVIYHCWQPFYRPTADGCWESSVRAQMNRVDYFVVLATGVSAFCAVGACVAWKARFSAGAVALFIGALATYFAIVFFAAITGTVADCATP